MFDVLVSSRRQVFGWGPLAALVALTGGAVALALVEMPGPPSPSVAAVFAATASGRTARFSEVSITTSENPDLRSRSTSSGSVDFANGDQSTAETLHNIEYGSSNGGSQTRRVVTITTFQRTLGGRQYASVSSSEPPIGLSIWGELPASTPVPKGVLGMLGPEALGMLNAPARDLSLVPIGRRTLEGEVLAGYEVVATSKDFPECPEVDDPSDGTTTQIWVDRDFRLRLVQTRSSYRVPRVGSPGFHGLASITTRMEITDYGQALKVSSPPPNPHGAMVSIIRMAVRCTGSG
jgi:hypothetical protein